MLTEKLARVLGHHFTRPKLLQQALVHRSYSGHNNERLEFLGDSVLDCVVAMMLFHHFPDLPEGDLSRLRSHLVKESALSELAVSLNLGEYLRMGEGESRSGGASRPSTLADAMEAVIGAVFLDGGFSAAESVITRLYRDQLEKLDPRVLGKDPKTLLQEYLQARKFPLPQYAVLAIEGQAHRQLFRVECAIPEINVCTEGEGPSRRMAEQQAAQVAYEIATRG